MKLRILAGLPALIAGSILLAAQVQVEAAAPSSAQGDAQIAANETTANTRRSTTSKSPVRKKSTKKRHAAVADKDKVWTNVTTGFQRAKAEKKWVIVDVYTQWCGWCKKLDKDTYSTQMVREFLASFVCIKADAEDGGAGQELAEKNEINGYPTTLIYSPDGELAGGFDGYVTPHGLIEKVTEIMDDKKNAPASKAKASEG